MKKYLYGIFYLLVSLIKFCYIKIFHYNNFKFTIYNLFSPFTEIDLSRNSSLKLGEFIKAKSGTKIKVRKNALVEIGNHTSFNHRCMVISHDRIKIGKNVQFGPNVLIYDHDHDFREKDGLRDLKYKTEPVFIGDNVWIGANVVILKGTVIGDNCVVGAGAIINGKFGNNKIIIQKREILINDYKCDLR